MIGGIVFVTGSNYFGILIPQKIREALDLVQQEISSFKSLPLADQAIRENALAQELLYFGLTVTGFVILKGILMFLMRQTIIVMSRLIEYDMRKEIYAHLQTLDQHFYSSRQTGDIMARISEDVSKVRNYLGPAVLYGINLVTLFIMTIYAMVEVNATLAGWALLPLPFLSLSIYYVSNQINRKSTLIQQQLSALNSTAQETYSGIRVVQSYVKENQFAAFFASQGDEFMKRSLSLARVDAYFQPLIALLMAISTLLVVLLGGYQVFDGNVSTGNIAEFILYVNMLTWPVTSIGWIASVIQEAEASQKRINELLREKPALQNISEGVYPIKGEFQVKNAGFRYKNTGILALKNISIQIRAGEKIAIVGKTGSGKSTLAELLIRLFDATEGEVWLDGIPIQKHNLSLLRQRIAYLPQDVFLFSDTIAANIAFGNPNASMEEIIQMAELACVKDDIARLPNGFATLVGERGVTLSGGQKQRIALARAFLTNPDIIVLDDALSAVDTNTEKMILSWLQNALKDKTAILITQRANNLLGYNQIFVLEKGELIDSGTHDQLIEKEGFYRSIYEQQMNNQ